MVKHGGKVEWHVNWRVSRGGQLVAGRWRMESIGGAFSSASTYNPTSYHASLAFLDFFPTFSLLLLPSFYSLPRVSTTFSTFIPSLTLSFVPISFFLFPSPFPSLSSSARRDRQVRSISLSLSLLLPPPSSLDRRSRSL